MSKAEIARLCDQKKEEGNQCYRRNEFEKAQQLYTDALVLQPKHAVCYSNRAACFLKLQKYTEAETDCSSAIKIDSSYVKAWVRRGIVRRAMNKLTEALDDLQEARKLDPKSELVLSEIQKTLDIQQPKVVEEEVIKEGKQQNSTPSRRTKAKAKQEDIKFIQKASNQQSGDKQSEMNNENILQNEKISTNDNTIDIPDVYSQTLNDNHIQDKLRVQEQISQVQKDSQCAQTLDSPNEKIESQLQTKIDTVATDEKDILSKKVDETSQKQNENTLSARQIAGASLRYLVKNTINQLESRIRKLIYPSDLHGIVSEDLFQWAQLRLRCYASGEDSDDVSGIIESAAECGSDMSLYDIKNILAEVFQSSTLDKQMELIKENKVTPINKEIVSRYLKAAGNALQRFLMYQPQIGPSLFQQSLHYLELGNSEYQFPFTFPVQIQDTANSIINSSNSKPGYSLQTMHKPQKALLTSTLISQSQYLLAGTIQHQKSLMTILAEQQNDYISTLINRLQFNLHFRFSDQIEETLIPDQFRPFLSAFSLILRLIYAKETLFKARKKFISLKHRKLDESKVECVSFNLHPLLFHEPELLDRTLYLLQIIAEQEDPSDTQQVQQQTQQNSSQSHSAKQTILQQIMNTSNVMNNLFSLLELVQIEKMSERHKWKGELLEQEDENLNEQSQVNREEWQINQLKIKRLQMRAFSLLKTMIIHSGDAQALMQLIQQPPQPKTQTHNQWQQDVLQIIDRTSEINIINAFTALNQLIPPLQNNLWQNQQTTSPIKTNQALIALQILNRAIKVSVPMMLMDVPPLMTIVGRTFHTALQIGMLILLSHSSSIKVQLTLPQASSVLQSKQDNKIFDNDEEKEENKSKSRCFGLMKELLYIIILGEEVGIPILANQAFQTVSIIQSSITERFQQHKGLQDCFIQSREEVGFDEECDVYCFNITDGDSSAGAISRQLMSKMI
ncbi:MAG: hypothetical protein EZS28_013717 [Streblomastix strix]|uniref:Uncharacterized protein n=1 Tax=Streblomastix strix TaxID=222440 RepID=A0A5J4W781_9EUKA|nr:MAG: hypothetical protein EZS28_013717 [Streblomastix strix]